MTTELLQSSWTCHIDFDQTFANEIEPHEPEAKFA